MLHGGHCGSQAHSPIPHPGPLLSLETAFQTHLRLKHHLFQGSFPHSPTPQAKSLVLCIPQSRPATEAGSHLSLGLAVPCF